MNRREFIVGSSAAVTAVVVGIAGAQPVYFGMDLGAGESFAMAAWQRNALVAVWKMKPRKYSADEAIRFVETITRLPAHAVRSSVKGGERS